MLKCLTTSLNVERASSLATRVLRRGLREVLGFVETLGRLRNVQSWVLVEESKWNQRDLVSFHRHNWEVLHSRNVCESKSGPNNRVVVSNVFSALSPDSQTSVCLRLVGEFTSSVKFIVLVFGNPQLLGSELGSLIIVRLFSSEKHLSSRHHDLVSNWLLGDRVDLVLVDDLVRSVSEWRLLNVTWLVNNGSLSDETNVVWVELWILLHSHHIVKDNGILVSVHSRVDSERKHVLMVRSQNSWSHVGTPWNSDVPVQRHGGQNTSGSNVDSDLSSLVENDVHHVLVVSNGSNGLNNKLSSSGDDRDSSSVVGVLVQQSTVLLVQTHSVWNQDGLTSSVNSSAVHVFDDTQTVATKRQTVTSGTKSSITQVECLFSVEWSSWVSVRDSHFTQGQSVNDRSSLEVDVVDSKSLSAVRNDSELPSLPLDLLAVHLERWAFWLLDDKRLERLDGLTVQVWVVLDKWELGPWLSIVDTCLINTRWQVVHSDKLFSQALENRREFQWQRIMVRFGVVSVGQVHVTLDQQSIFHTISSVHPRVANNLDVGRKLQFCNFSLDNRVRGCELLDLFNVLSNQRTLNALWLLLVGDDVAVGHVDQSLVKLESEVVVHISDSWNTRQRFSGLFSFKVLEHVLLWRVQSVDLDEVRLLRALCGILDELGCQLDLFVRNWVERMNHFGIFKHFCWDSVLQHESDLDESGHHREVLCSWNMGESKSSPDDRVGISHVFLSVGPFFQTGVDVRLVGELSSCVQLVVLVLGDPELLGSKVCSLGVERVVISKKHLSGRHQNLVANRSLGGLIDNVLVDDLVGSVGEWRLLDVTWLVNNGSLGEESNVVWVKVRTGRHSFNIVVNNGVVVAVDGRVDSERQQVLVVGGHDKRTNICTPIHSLVFLDWHGGQNTGSSHVNSDLTGLVKDNVEQILVVSDGSNGLNNKLSSSSSHGTSGSVVHVLVQQATVLLVQADSAWDQARLTFRVGDSTVKVLDDSQTVATELQGVSGGTESSVTKIESLLSVVRSSWVSVRNSHLRQGQSVDNGSSLEVDVVDSKSLSAVWNHGEFPSLPGDLVTINVERRTFWLLDNQRLQRSQGLAVQVWVILDQRKVGPWLGVLQRCGIGSSWKIVHSDKLVSERFKHRRELKRQRVVVGLWVVGVGQVHVALNQQSVLIVVVGSVNPRVANNLDVWGQV
ncbi:hypothetical protein OGAPHI_004859 [Ogataea philodendri]|uniref:Uncharacterized protein n=1 Tax=Ogataea philodendri TaxID=1378263 RepID=A0A9P8T3M2_9ASCO|nr:uncharacterized protein OGAPHI_004859 [Ogataea philodendri]KAH3664145.1 hypothetical protein OGAPHI_004859 [Ogataea philodendri]